MRGLLGRFDDDAVEHVLLALLHFLLDRRTLEAPQRFRSESSYTEVYSVIYDSGSVPD